MQTPPSFAPAPDAVSCHVSRAGVQLGVFPLAEVRRRRWTGEFSGVEHVWYPGLPDWRPIDEILRLFPSPPPALASFREASPSKPFPWKPVLWIGGSVLVLGLAAFIAGGVWFVRQVREGIEAASAASETHQTASYESPSADGVEYAAAVTWPETASSVASRRPAELEFRERHYLEGYRRDGLRNHPTDADALAYVETSLDVGFGEPNRAAEERFAALGERLLAASPAPEDPMVLSLLANNAVRTGADDRIALFERAAKAYARSSHRLYPRFNTLVLLGNARHRDTERLVALDRDALAALGQAVRDGTLPPGDSEILADNLVHGWGETFFDRQGEAVCMLFAEAGPDWAWLHHVLVGEHHINLAWKARGGGYANTVKAAGWKGFREHLDEARPELMRAWTLHPERPIAADRLMTVSMGQSDMRELRRWFDRAIAAQCDHREAWSNLRWALRPRWFGSHEAMLALGDAALDTGRFDTEVPRQMLSSIYELGLEQKLPKDEALYGHPDYWPRLVRMYEGYIGPDSRPGLRDSYRTGYACAAYLAGEYEIAAAQLEALGGKPVPSALRGWDTDLSLLPQLVAAHNGPNVEAVAAAERAWRAEKWDEAREKYRALLSASPDAAARELAEARLKE